MLRREVYDVGGKRKFHGLGGRLVLLIEAKMKLRHSSVLALPRVGPLWILQQLVWHTPSKIQQPGLRGLMEAEAECLWAKGAPYDWLLP